MASAVLPFEDLPELAPPPPPRPMQWRRVLRLLHTLARDAEQGADFLERPLLGSTAAPRVRRSTRRRLRRVHDRDLPTLAAIDQGAFAAGWQNDAASLADIVSATPQAHSRLAVDRRRPVGFAITGKAGTTGYIQRIAVRPDARRNGVGRQLLDDAVQWLMRRGASRALVNTGTENVAALEMYAAAAFEPLADELVVLEHRRAS